MGQRSSGSILGSSVGFSDRLLSLVLQLEDELSGFWFWDSMAWRL